MSDRPQPAYDGDEPYIFVTYAHEDTGLVYPHIRWLQQHGFNVWWDEGISPGAHWRAEIAQAIRGCSLLVYFVTPKSVATEHCTREVHFALDEYRRPVLAVHLVETTLPDALALSLSDRQAIMQHSLEPEDYERKLALAITTYLDQPVPDVALSASPRRPSQPSAWLLVFIGAFLGIAITAFATWMTAERKAGSDRPAARFAIELPPGDQISTFPSFPLAISKAGTSFLFSAESSNGLKIYRRKLDDLEIEPISGTEGGSSFFFSPDEQSILFYDFNVDALKKVPISGGGPATVVSDTLGFNGLSFRSDGEIFFTRSSGPVLQLSDSSGAQEPVTRTEAGERHVHPFLKGSVLLYSAVAEDDPSAGRIEALSLETGRHKVLEEGLMPRVTSSGHLLFARGDSIWAAPFDAERMELTSSPVPVLENVSTSISSAPQFAVSDEGSMIYLPKKTAGQDALVWVDTEGNEIDEITLPVPPAPYAQPRISPDGHRALVRIENPGDVHFWVYSFERRQLSKLDDRAITALWSADGKKVIYSQMGPKGVTLVQRNLDGTGDTEVLIDNERDQHPTSRSNDGVTIFYYECTNLAIDCDIGELTMSEQPSARLLLQGNFMERHPALSPDQRWLAYESNRSGRYEVYVRPYPDFQSARWQVSTEGGSRPIWSPDGRTLYYAEGEDTARRMMAVGITSGEEFVAGIPEPLFEFESKFLARIIRNHDIHPDGDRFLLATPGESRTQRPIYVQNWLDEVERLVPVHR